MKIQPLNKYKTTSTGFKLDKINPRRVSLLLLLAFALFIWFIDANKEALLVNTASAGEIIRPVIEKSKDQIALETYMVKRSAQYRRVLPANEATKYASHILKYSKENKVDPYLIAGLMEVESTFDKYAISSCGALGLTQIMPEWHKDKINKLIVRFGSFNPFNAEHNIALGTMIYSEYKKRHRGSKSLALLQYNGSIRHKNPTYAKNVMGARAKVVAWANRT